MFDPIISVVIWALVALVGMVAVMGAVYFRMKAKVEALEAEKAAREDLDRRTYNPVSYVEMSDDEQSRRA